MGPLKGTGSLDGLGADRDLVTEWNTPELVGVSIGITLLEINLTTYVPNTALVPPYPKMFIIFDSVTLLSPSTNVRGGVNGKRSYINKSVHLEVTNSRNIGNSINRRMVKQIMAYPFQGLFC